MTVQAVQTQTKYPWQTVARTIFQGAIGLCALVPIVVQTSGIEGTSSGIAAFVVVTGAVTKVMALKPVNDWLNEYVPFLGAGPSVKQVEETADAASTGVDPNA